MCIVGLSSVLQVFIDFVCFLFFFCSGGVFPLQSLSASTIGTGSERRFQPLNRCTYDSRDCSSSCFDIPCFFSCCFLLVHSLCCEPFCLSDTFFNDGRLFARFRFWFFRVFFFALSSCAVSSKTAAIAEPSRSHSLHT